jgi:arabinan endo-1,5-alpha-L-arabinosidase
MNARGGAGGAAGVSARGGASGGTAGASGSGGAASCPGARYDAASPPTALALTGNLGTHDPVAIFSGGRFYEFQTGPRLPTKTSSDLRSWAAGPAVFSANPSWIATQVPGATDLWAPDISFFGGQFHLYYSASTFGSNRSCIGHATRATLDSGGWTDRGSVVCSNAGSAKDDWNAIDPNVVVDGDGTPWLAFGSFWGGLKMVKLNETGARADTTLRAIAARPDAGGALEAPFVFERCGTYYLFMSWDKCCNGANSTYNIRVGRATSVTGPYVDKAGKSLMQGGGTLVTAGDSRWKGPGHNAIIVVDGRTYNVHHAYDAQNNGNSVLRISEIAWDAEGWPVSPAP